MLLCECVCVSQCRKMQPRWVIYNVFCSSMCSALILVFADGSENMLLKYFHALKMQGCLLLHNNALADLQNAFGENTQLQYKGRIFETQCYVTLS